MPPLTYPIQMLGTEVEAFAHELASGHERLDQAVAAAYGWKWPLSEDEVLSQLLVLNLERAAEWAS